MPKPEETYKTLAARRERYWQQLQVTYSMIAKLPEHVDIFKGRCAKLSELASKFENTLAEMEQVISLCPDLPDDTAKVQLAFDELYYTCNSKYEALLPASTSLPSSPEHHPPPQHGLLRRNLPEIKLPTFSGDIESFESFAALFNNLVNKNSSLSAIEKFTYLKAHLSGEPKLIVDAIPYNASSYTAALQALMDKYSNARIQLAHHFNKLLNLQPIKTQSQLKELVSVIHTNVEAIKRLQVPDLASAILLHIVLRLLDSKTRIDFEREQVSDGNNIPSYDNLIKFLQNQCLISDLANFEISKSNKQTESSKNQNSKSATKKSFLASQSSTSSQPSTSAADPSRPSRPTSPNSGTCKLCSKSSHRLVKCFKFLEMPIQKRQEYARSGGYCMVCLFSHPGKPCSSKGQCRWCSDSGHNSYLCATSQSSEGSTNQQPSSSSSCPENSTRNVNSCRIESQGSSSNHVLLGTALVRVKNSAGQWYGPCRALCDSGSEVNFISEGLAQSLGLSRKPCPFQVSGIGQSGPLSVKGMTSCTLASLHDSNHVASFEVIITPTISVEVPSSKLPSSVTDQFAHLPLADPKCYSQSKVDLLLGVQAYLDILSQPLSILKGNPSATQTIFGYVLSGNVDAQRHPSTRRSFMVQTAPKSVDETLRRFWEFEETLPVEVPQDPDEEFCEKHFRETIKRDSSGRYIASLPWKTGVRPVLGSNREIALQRLSRLENRFRIDEGYGQLYKNVIRDYISQGLAVPAKTTANYLLTHHGVRKDSSTCPLRVVFNPSETCSTLETLNSFLHTGPKLQSDIGNITLLYRLEPVALTCDIKGMFLAISLDEEDRKYQHFLFRFDPNEPVQEWELTCVVFGMVSSPYIAQRVLKQLCEDEGHRFPRASQIVSNCCYVDNIVCTAPSYHEALQIHQELTQFLAAGGFILRKWASSDERVSSKIDAELRELPRPLNSINTEAIKILGTEWDPVSDSFRFAVDKLDVERPTKRNILSQVARVYDLNGFVNPFVFSLKCILQKLWLEGLQWDDVISKELQQRWKEVSSDFPNLSQVVIPRFIMGSIHWQSAQLIGFGDASELGFSAVLFLRVVQEDGAVLCNLIRAKSKVAPLKTVSIPRLELNAAVLLTRLLMSVKVLTDKIQIQSVHLFTDSTTTLAWIHTPPHKLATYVANRVVFITDNSPIASWRYVPTGQNPADLASRGLSASELVSCQLWWHGPSFLLEDESNWPERKIELPHEVPEMKIRKVLTSTKVSASPIVALIERCSSLGKATRVMVYVHRFIDNRFLTPTDHVKGPISAKEMEKAMNCLVKVTQHHFLSEDIRLLQKGELSTPKYRALTLFISEEGFVRVGGRLKNAPLPEKSKHPLLIPHGCPLAARIVDHYHLNSLHGGPRLVMALILRYYWIPSIRRLIRSRLHQCKICFTLSAKPQQPTMADLPRSRFAGNRCFFNTAVDFCGPFTVKESNRRNAIKHKTYGAIFVCMTTKATHLELVSSLSTEACLAALDRFIARRGLPSRIYSDQGRNFIGCSRELREMNTLIHQSNERFIQHLGRQGITWIHNPPYAPNFNGLVEAAVKSTKHHMKRVISSLVLTFEEMYTLFTRIEAVLNSRPLCPISTSPSDGFDFLTPGHFLTGGPLLARPELDLADVPLNHLDRWQLLSHSLQSFWTKWKKEYLHTLMERTKWTTPNVNVKVGDLVLLYDSSVMPLNWPMGRVEDVIPGDDGVVRVVKVRTPTGSVLRPTNKVVALPIHQ